MTETHFTADAHFGHPFVAGIRGFESHLDHDEWLLTTINEAVGPRDEVWFLGDFRMGQCDQERANRIFRSLHGRWNLVVGNHDPRWITEMGWSSVHQMVRRRFNRRTYIMCHYPLLTWENAHYGSWHLHGHSHGNLDANPTTRMDVGIDSHPERRPFSLPEIEAILSDRTYDPVDHHERDERDD